MVDISVQTTKIWVQALNLLSVHIDESDSLIAQEVILDNNKEDWERGNCTIVEVHPQMLPIHVKSHQGMISLTKHVRNVDKFAEITREYIKTNF